MQRARLAGPLAPLPLGVSLPVTPLSVCPSVSLSLGVRPRRAEAGISRSLSLPARLREVSSGRGRRGGGSRPRGGAAGPARGWGLPVPAAAFPLPARRAADGNGGAAAAAAAALPAPRGSGAASSLLGLKRAHTRGSRRGRGHGPPPRGAAAVRRPALTRGAGGREAAGCRPGCAGGERRSSTSVPVTWRCRSPPAPGRGGAWMRHGHAGVPGAAAG